MTPVYASDNNPDSSPRRPPRGGVRCRGQVLQEAGEHVGELGVTSLAAEIGGPANVGAQFVERAWRRLVIGQVPGR
ncbi:MAG: hypothetical protein HOW71_40770, partial [Nonomuraea sp.]|nr:hypothetical protein [Nonomuraea sp.]